MNPTDGIYIISVRSMAHDRWHLVAEVLPVHYIGVREAPGDTLGTHPMEHYDDLRIRDILSIQRHPVSH